MNTFIDAILKTVDSRHSVCHEVMRPESPYGAGNEQICGLQSTTFCDAENCEVQLCPEHVNTCPECSMEFCGSCSIDHRCK